MARSRDEELDDEMYKDILDEERRLEQRDPYDGVKCISCMDDPTLCRQLGVCDEPLDLDMLLDDVFIGI